MIDSLKSILLVSPMACVNDMRLLLVGLSTPSFSEVTLGGRNMETYRFDSNAFNFKIEFVP